MKPIKTKIAILLLGVLLVGVSGCKKCYECSVLMGTFKCNNGVDTIILSLGHKSVIVDSMNNLYSRGYTNCDTQRFIWVTGPWDVINNPICTQESYKAYKELGDECTVNK